MENKGKKIFLKEIADYENKELLKEIFEHNEELGNNLWNLTWDRNMEQQLEFGNLCLGENSHKYIDIRDHYSSFYLTLKNAEEFVNNIDKAYLTTEEDTLYNECIELLEKRNNEEYGNDYYWEFDIELDNKAEELLKLIEKDLHAYENVETEDVFEEFLFQLIENENYGELYYYENDPTYNLYEDISYTKNWN